MRVRAVSLLVALLLLAAPTGAEQAATSDVDPEALAILQRATARITAAQGLRVQARALYDVVQEDGLKLQFGRRGDLRLRRPDRVALVRDQDDGSTRHAYYDGQTFTVFDVEPNVYGQYAVPATIDETLDFLELELGATLPFADLLYNDLSHLGENASAAAVVGESRVGDWVCDQLVFRGEDLDWQVWVERGEEPVLRKLLVTYKKLEGMPQHMVELDGWDFEAKLPDEAFAFVPPPGSEQIATLAPRDAVEAE